MLYSVDSGKYITHVPHAREFSAWCERLDANEYEAIVAALNARIDGNEIHTSSWIPGSDWSGTVWLPIYAKACRRNEDAAARFFGLLLWSVLMERDEVWGFGRYEKDGVPIRGMTYYRLETPPPR